MTTLVILRHAKAVSDASGGDHARALNKRGRAAAAAVGDILREVVPPITLALVSDARRTVQTAELALASYSTSIEIRHDRRLYAASTEAILAVLRAVGPETEAVLVVGHNPGIGDLARQLAGHGRDDDLKALQGRFPTATVAIVDLGAMGWPNIGPKAGTLRRLVLADEAE